MKINPTGLTAAELLEASSTQRLTCRYCPPETRFPGTLAGGEGGRGAGKEAAACPGFPLLLGHHPQSERLLLQRTKLSKAGLLG